MTILLKIAWRNIWRHPSRSIVVITAITLGLLGGNFVSAVSIGFLNQSFHDTIKQRVSHIQLHDPLFVKEGEAIHTIDDGRSIVEILRKNPEVKGIAGRMRLDGLVSSAHLTSGINIVGVDREFEIALTGIDQQIEKGEYFVDEGRLPSAVIGRELADKLKSDVGSRITATFQNIEGEIISASFRVEGIFTSTSTPFELQNLFVRINDINDLIGDANAITEIAILMKDHDDYEEMTERLKKEYPGLSVRSWRDLAPDLNLQLSMINQSLMWIIGIILLGVGFGLLNTILMSVLERRREFGMLMSIGFKRARVFGMIMTETVMLALTGGLTGLLFSFGLVRILNKSGLDLSLVGGENLREFGFSPVIYPDLGLFFYFQVALMVIIFAILSSIYPAVKGVKLVPAEAVRQE